MISGIETFWTPEESTEVLDFFAAHPELSERRPIQQHLQRMMINVKARDHLLSGLGVYLLDT